MGLYLAGDRDSEDRIRVPLARSLSLTIMVEPRLGLEGVRMARKLWAGLDIGGETTRKDICLPPQPPP